MRYLLFYFLGVFVCFSIGLTATSYFSIDELLKIMAPDVQNQKNNLQSKNSNQTSITELSNNSNLRQLAALFVKYVDELNAIENLANKVSQKKAPEICSALCNPSAMDFDQLKEQPGIYLANYYQQQGANSLNDPAFRLRLSEVHFVSQLFSAPLRTLLKEVHELAQRPLNEIKFSKKLDLSLKLEIAAIKELIFVYNNKQHILQKKEQLETLNELILECKKGTPPKPLISECQSKNLSL
ncbi:MAG: hypothetical protein ACXVCY_15660 [Pseudobdellovibrionaceae bacterium]